MLLLQEGINFIFRETYNQLFNISSLYCVDIDRNWADNVETNGKMQGENRYLTYFDDGLFSVSTLLVWWQSKATS